MNRLPDSFSLSDEVELALRSGVPVVALESTVITHGLPHPENLELASELEQTIREIGCVPATVAVLDGVVNIGIEIEQLQRLARAKEIRKVSSRDLASTIARGESGGTTVAATIFAANHAGIKVFATGGIGGVHRHPTFDISADLIQLSQTPMIVVCSGAKAILDLPATIEYLETYSVPVVGFQTDEFPAFYSIQSGLKTSASAESPGEIAAIARAHWEIGMTSAVLVVQPPPSDVALPLESAERAIQEAIASVEKGDLRGQGVTPYLLQKVSDLTKGASMQVNLALLRNNARLAALIANQLQQNQPGLIQE